MISLDFAPGSHGHFLDYIVNAYIFNRDVRQSNIFQSSGACHTINVRENYQKNRVTRLGHFTSFNQLYPPATDKVLWIRHDRRFDFVLLTNTYFRCHPGNMNQEDFNVNEIMELQKSMMISGDTQLGSRSDWYAKLTDGLDYANLEPKTEIPLFEFDYASFFDISDFLRELRRLADWLNRTLVYDDSLAKLWHDFIQRNQGFTKYLRTREILDHIITNTNSSIESDWQIHAYLNYLITGIFRIYDGPLFEQEIYPDNTQDVYKLISEHVRTFTERFKT